MVQDTTGVTSVATLITIIALLIMAYMILIPADDRAELLRINEPFLPDKGTTSTHTSEYNLLNEAPGEVNPYKKDTHLHSLTPISLYNKLESDSKKIANSMTITRNIFTNTKRTLTFNLNENTEKAFIYANIVKGEGELTIKLNSNVVYEGRLTTNELPIELPETYFSNNNVLEFKATSPGWAFWSSNEYELKDITLLTKSRTENKKASRSFVISSSEKQNMEEAELDYFLYCVKDDGGMMRIFLNEKLLFTDIIVCDIKQSPIDIDPTYLKEGTNMIEFQIDTGDYRIEQIELETELGEKFYPRYSFYVDKALMDSIEDHNKEIELGMELEGKERKRAIITINENQVALDTKSEDFTRDISSYIEQGTNHIKIIPKNTFEIEQIYVDVV